MSVLAIVQARLSSKRFPGKSLADFNGEPLVRHVVRRVRQITSVDHVVLGVPKGQVGKLLFAARVIGPDVPENDVLARFVVIANELPEHDTIVRVTGDCPLLQPDVCDRLIAEWRASGCEYGWTDTHTGIWPDGLDVEVFTRDLLMQAHMQATDPHDREHVTPIMRRMRQVFSLPADSAFNDWPKVSIDTPEDLERVSEFSRILDVA
jgi:spore coat polysaccharide biosynthesis protein SpsF (cytidylyltransferase family)